MTEEPHPEVVRWTAAFNLAILAIAANWYLSPRMGYGASFTLTFLLLGVVPAVFGSGLLRRTPASLGLGPGDVRWGLGILALGVPLALVAGAVGAGSEALARVYPLSRALTLAAQDFVPYALAYGLYYVGFEFLFRGYLLLGFAERLGPGRANLLQSVLAVLAHVGKPGIEIAAAFPASLAFGWAALRTKSIWYVTLVHWLVGIGLDWSILRAAT